MTERLSLSSHEHVAIVEESPERLVVEVHYEGSDTRPPTHLHPQQDERFEVLEGTLHAVVDGDARTLRPGDTLEIPRETPHQMWVPEGEARARWETAPAGRTAELFRRLDALNRETGGRPDMQQLIALVTEFGDVFRLA